MIVVKGSSYFRKEKNKTFRHSGAPYFFIDKRMDKQYLKRWIQKLIEADELWRFYKCPEWLSLKQQVLSESHYECAECRKHGKITRYDIDAKGRKRLLSTVHHVKHVRDYPELALSRTYVDGSGTVKKNLIPVCKKCHNRLHPEKNFKKNKKTDKFFNEERW